jgi:hypothetical protein
MAYENDRYPNWRERWDKKVDRIDDEIEGWWKRTKANWNDADTPGAKLQAAGAETARAGDRIGDTIAGKSDVDTWAERTGDTVRNWWADVRNNVRDWFDGDNDTDDVRAEVRKAWDDDEYLAERFTERQEDLRRRGRI